MHRPAFCSTSRRSCQKICGTKTIKRCRLVNPDQLASWPFRKADPQRPTRPRAFSSFSQHPPSPGSCQRRLDAQKFLLLADVDFIGLPLPRARVWHPWCHTFLSPDPSSIPILNLVVLRVRNHLLDKVVEKPALQGTTPSQLLGCAVVRNTRATGVSANALGPRGRS